MKLKKVEFSDFDPSEGPHDNPKVDFYNKLLNGWKPIEERSVLVIQIYTNKEDVGFSTDSTVIPLSAYLPKSSKSVRNFADRNGFDYRLVERDYISPFKRFQSSNFLKYESLKYLKDYDVVLYVDTDVIIGYDVENFLEYYNGWSNVILKTRLGGIEENNNLVNKIYRSHINSGVMIFYKWAVINRISHRVFNTLEYFSERIPLEMIPKYASGHYNDETFFKYFLIYDEILYQHLSDKFNMMYTTTRDETNLEEVIVHYTGKTKKRMLKRSI